MGFLTGKRILVTGVASKLSIAYGIAQAMHREGAELAFTYQNDKLKGRVEEFAAQLGSSIVLPCDVAEDASIEALFSELVKVWPKFDGFVHSIGFAPGDQLDGDYVNAVTRDGFKIAHDISSYSFVALAKSCREMLNPGSALLTLSYLGAERAIPNYNVMGLAKASLEANVRYMANAMGRKVFVLTVSLLARSAPSRHLVSKISVKCSPTAKQLPRFAAPLPLKMWVTPLRSCVLTCPQVFPVKLFTLMAVSTSLQ
jgi:enoyl-[acyl-carrier protein] reductase I